MDWSRDGRYLLFTTDGGATRSPFNELRPKFSPDGKWIAYVSDESGDTQVYVRSFPSGAVKIQISNAGGNHACGVRRDGPR